MSQLVDELIEICGISLMDLVLCNVTKFVQLAAITPAPKPLSSSSSRQPPRLIPVVFHEPGELLVVDKPADLVINSNDSSRESVQTLLKRQFASLANHSLRHDFYFAHRLDYATSGLLCIPLNKRRCAEISSLFEQRKIAKYYLAIVRGHIAGPSEISIDIPVGEDIRYKTGNNKMCTSHDWEHCLSPKRCETKLIVLERGFYETEFATKVLLMPVTGRRHQLRVHCSEIGHPIVGDYTYSSHTADCGKDAVNAPPRMMLHAYRMRIPATASHNKSIDVTAEDPFLALDGIQWRKMEVLNGVEEAIEKVTGI